MADNSLPKVAERSLPDAAMANVTHVRVVSTDNSEKLPIENLTLAGTKVTVAVDGLSGTVDGAFGDVLTQIAGKADTTQVEALDAEKVDKTQSVIAGAGMTGGGTLAGDVTLNVNTYNGLDSTSTTRPLSAAQGKNLVDADAAIVDDQKAVHPEIAYNKRVVADGGTIHRKKETVELHQEALDILASAKFMWDGHAGTKRRVSGANTFATKIYSMDGADNDGVQTVEANQPYLGGLIAKNESSKLIYGTSRTLDVTDVVLAANAAWSFVVVVKPNAPSVIDLGAGSLTLTAAAIKINNGIADILSCVGDNNFGLERIIVFSYQGDGSGSIWIDGVLQTTTTVSGAMTFGEIGFTSGDYSLSGATIFDRKLEAAEVNSLYAFLRSIHPPIETTHVGSQQIATSNLEAAVFGGTAIHEVQNAFATEIITNVADREFSSDTGYWGGISYSIGGGVCNFHCTESGDTYIVKESLLTVGRWYQFSYEITRNAAGNMAIYANTGTLIDSNVGAHLIKFKAGGSQFALGRHGGATDIDVDNISILALGWDDSMAIYDARIAAGDTVPQASIAAMMWCHYNNNTAIGAIYGKLYNGYAVPVINAAAPSGYHVPSDLEWTQLSESLGGNAVSGGKMKAQWGGFDNAFATNESGVSLLAGGVRTTNGAFVSNGSTVIMWGLGAKSYAAEASNTLLTIVTDDNKYGFSIRLFSNTPYLTTNLYESGWFATDIASTPKSIRIPFGCKVTNTKCVTTTNVTSIEAKLFSYDGTELETLITGKACNATTKSFTVVADQTVSYTDNYVRVTGAGNSGTGMNIIVTIEMI